MEALILEISTRGLHRYHAIDREVTTIGRALDNDIILSDPTVAPHHLKIIRYGDNSIEFVNLTEVNPTRIDNQRIESLVTEKLPVILDMGRVRLQLLPRDYGVAATKSLAGSGPSSHLFGHFPWAVILVLACLILGGIEFYMNNYISFKWSDLFKHVLREVVFTIGAFVIALSIIERLLVNRWEIKQLVTSISLVYLLYYISTRLADGFDYLLSTSWPTTLFHFGWYLLLIPTAITLYLIHISHLKNSRSIILAVLISSPIAIPSILQSAQLQALLDDYSSAAKYQNSLSPLNWHIKDTVTIEGFIDEAKSLAPGKFAD